MLLLCWLHLRVLVNETPRYGVLGTGCKMVLPTEESCIMPAFSHLSNAATVLAPLKGVGERDTSVWGTWNGM